MHIPEKQFSKSVRGCKHRELISLEQHLLSLLVGLFVI
jgi:hypothetical protein